MTVSDLISEELDDPALKAELTLDVKVDVDVFVVTHPEERQRGVEANDQELEGEH